jgi:predicted HAD superfamily phosphohydrolase YqeG
MDVLIFVTNVLNRDAVSRVQPLLAGTPTIKQWNFDLEDCDHILRVVSNNLSPRKVESMLNSAGFDCYELEY